MERMKLPSSIKLYFLGNYRKCSQWNKQAKILTNCEMPDFSAYGKKHKNEMFIGKIHIQYHGWSELVGYTVSPAKLWFSLQPQLFRYLLRT